jgi:hypothetical protein
MLPAVFQIDDPVLGIVFDPVHAQGLHRLVVSIDADIFQAEDSLGWTYQFWRAAEKDAINEAPDVREAVCSYNRDDCFSALALRDWLEAVRAREEQKRVKPSHDLLH